MGFFFFLGVIELRMGSVFLRVVCVCFWVDRDSYVFGWIEIVKIRDGV